MRNIQKTQEPGSLTEHKKKLHADYDNYTDKDALRRQLVNEQHGLCCYCQSRIRPTSQSMKIEHWQCQDNYARRQLDYRNLLGACLGGDKKPGEDEHVKRITHCDTLKGNRDISFNPADPACDVEQLIRFTGKGLIGSNDADIDRELNEILNLNWSRLVNNRVAVLTAFQQRLETGRRLDPARELPKWNGSQAGELEPYSQMVVYYLKKKQGRATA